MIPYKILTHIENNISMILVVNDEEEEKQNCLSKNSPMSPKLIVDNKIYIFNMISNIQS